MKTSFLLASLLLALGYAAAIAARFVGLLSTPVFTLPVFASCFTTSLVLALAFNDYARRSTYDRPRGKRVAPPTPVASPTPAAAWGCQTISA